MRWARVGAAAIAGGILAMVACGTDPVGVDACRRIETVRCESAQACGISLERPVHRGSSPEDNVAACVRYYDDQCLHGLVTTKDPGAPAVDACVQAIITGDCSVVKAPESSPACAFLLPPSAAPVDAGADTGTGTGTGNAGAADAASTSDGGTT